MRYMLETRTLKIRSDNFIRIAFYPYIVPKQKITISLDSEIAKALRLQSIEKYGDSRSMSRLIEDLAMGEVKKEHDPEAVKANREEYCRTFMEEQTKPICWPCGKGWIDLFVCKACDCEFHAPIPDANFCPACSSTQISSWVDSHKPKSIDDRIEELDFAKFPEAEWKLYRKEKGRYAKRKL